MKTSKLIVLSLVALFMFNCSNDSESDLIEKNEEPEDDTPAVLINYTDDISPIIQSACIGCHASPPVNGAPFSLINYAQVEQRAGGVFNRMNLQSGSPGAMPPSGRLPQSTIDKIQDWIDAGKPEN